MQTIGDRICEIRRFYFGEERGANTSFAEKIGVSTNVTSNWCSRGDNIGTKVINQILAAFPNVDKGWLIGGNGHMLKEPIQEENAVTIIGNAASSIGSTIGMNLESSIGTAISSGAACASASSGLGGIFGTLFGSLFGSKDDITEEEAADILKEALDDLKRISAENEELKNEVEYWRTKANNLEYQLSKTKAG